MNCSEISQGATIFGNENKIINGTINVSQLLPTGNYPLAGVNIIGNKNEIRKFTISNTLTISNSQPTDGINFNGIESFENVVDSTTITGYWNSVYISNSSKMNTISNNTILKSINMGIYLYNNANNNIRYYCYYYYYC